MPCEAVIALPLILSSIDRGTAGSIIIFCVIVTAFLLVVILVKSRAVRRAMWFKSPFPERGGVGALGDLSAVEAGIVMSVDIPCLLAMYLLDLATCSDVRIIDQMPPKVEVLTREGISDFHRRFLDAVKEDGSLDAERMMLALDWCYSELDRSMKGHGVRDTVIHYLDKVDRLWDELESKLVPEDRLDILEAGLPWLLLHEEAADRLESTFIDSAKWQIVKPLVKKMRLASQRIISEEELLRHAAYHPDGIFSNERYLEGILDWARHRLSDRMIAPGWYVDYFRQGASESYERESERMEKLQKLLEMIESRISR